MQKIQKLSNGVEIPSLGFGTYLIPDGDIVENAVKDAIRTGYRHIDGATIYGNEAGVGQGIKQSGIKREELFLTGKVWNSDQGYESTIKAFETSLEKWQTEYLDLYLIHWPGPFSGETWKALETLYRDKRVRAIGVSNFTISQMEELLKTAEIAPIVNQIELHPRHPQYELQAFCKSRNISIESWSPLIQGKIFEKPLIKELAEKYNCSISQLAIVWQFMQDNITLVKSVNPDRIKANFLVPDIKISKEDLVRMKTLEGEMLGPDPVTFNY